jgi:hypothetical protein
VRASKKALFLKKEAKNFFRMHLGQVGHLVEPDAPIDESSLVLSFKKKRPALRFLTYLDSYLRGHFPA